MFLSLGEGQKHLIVEQALQGMCHQAGFIVVQK